MVAPGPFILRSLIKVDWTVTPTLSIHTSARPKSRRGMRGAWRQARSWRTASSSDVGPPAVAGGRSAGLPVPRASTCARSPAPRPSPSSHCPPFTLPWRPPLPQRAAVLRRRHGRMSGHQGWPGDRSAVAESGDACAGAPAPCWSASVWVALKAMPPFIFPLLYLCHQSLP